MRKPRIDSKLKTLPDNVQAEIVGRMRGDRPEAVAKWIAKEHGIRTSVPALYRFGRWWVASRPLVQAAEIADELKSALAKSGAAVDPDALSQIGQAAFEVLALKTQDPELYYNMRKLRQQDTKLSLARRRIEALERRAAQADEAAGIASDQSLTPKEKDARMRALFRM